jgi:hypothetical protein
MKYLCRDCKFTWEGFPDIFDQVLTHKKTYKKGKSHDDL